MTSPGQLLGSSSQPVRSQFEAPVQSTAHSAPRLHRRLQFDASVQSSVQAVPSPVQVTSTLLPSRAPNVHATPSLHVASVASGVPEPPQAVEEMYRELDRAERQLGFEVRDGLLEAARPEL